MPEPQQLVARYAIYGEIASGGMATVHLGRLIGAVGFSRTVAIKKLHAQYAHDPEFVSMFLDEAKLAARIAHPNVVPTLDVIAEAGELFLVMEYVQGESLARLLKKGAQRGDVVPIPIVTAVMAGALHGLHAAHEAKDTRGDPLDIVHRDVSPQNILVGVDGVARVLDFGIAKASGRAHTTRDGRVKGKLAYMAPEQLQGRATRQTDVFAAGIVLWETLTSRRLFASDHEGETMKKVTSLAVAPPSHHVPEVPPELDAIVLRALERDPERRFPTAEDMAFAIEQCAPPALASEVGAWVKLLAAEVLEERSLKLAEIESDPLSVRQRAAAPAVTPRPRDLATASLVVPVSTPPPPSAPAPRASPTSRRRILALGVAAVGAVAAAAYVVTVSRAQPPSAASVVAPHASSGPAPATASAAAPVETLESKVSAPASLDAAVPSAVPASSARGPGPRPARTSKPTASASNKCDPPYEHAPDGKLVPKPGCL